MYAALALLGHPWCDSCRSLGGPLCAEERHMQACQRCGSIGTTQPFRGTGDARPRFHKIPIQLCLDCRLAHESWLRHRLKLDIGGCSGIGRVDIVGEATAVWGSRAPDMLALLLVARDSMDAASRLLRPEVFEEVRSWLEANLEGSQRDEGALSGRPQAGTVRSAVGQGATPARAAVDSRLRGYPREQEGAPKGRAAKRKGP
jgi:hypothetical protein